MELKIEIPNELEELGNASKINWQLALEERLKEELERLVRLRKIVSKSKLTQKQANKLADEVSLSLAKRYKKLLEEKQ